MHYTNQIEPIDDPPAPSGRRGRRLRRIFALASMAVLAVPSVAVAGHCNHDRGDHHVGHELAKVRRATAKYHRVGRAERAGYQLGYQEPFLLDHCIAHPTDGAMGYHWFNHDGIHDLRLDPRRPEGLVYEPLPNGKLKLVAVEWIVPAADWHAAGHEDPPELLGQELHILNPALGWYILHAWVFKPNPSGVFSDWNPDVTCP